MTHTVPLLLVEDIKIEASFRYFCLILVLFSFLAGDEWDYIMSEVQGTLEFSLELHKFHNVDLFQRG